MTKQTRCTIHTLIFVVTVVQKFSPKKKHWQVDDNFGELRILVRRKQLIEEKNGFVFTQIISCIL